MNKIVRDHYPVANLPEDLREGLGDVATVRVVVEVEGKTSVDDNLYPGLTEFQDEPRKPMTAAELIERIREYQRHHPEGVTTEEAVARIRALRDEWDDE
jgi:hypothetical protein